MRKTRSGRLVRAHRVGLAIAALMLPAALVVGGEPPAGPDELSMNHYPADCPGRHHHGRELPPGPPTVMRYRVAPYGVIWGYPVPAVPPRAPAMPLPADYRAKLYHMVECPQQPVGDRFPGLDSLVTLMGHEGLKFYKSSTVTMESGPDGLIAADDVVVIKINYQWSERGGTNTDLLRGLIQRIVEHPDGFTGEIVVCENAQFASTSGMDRPSNNAEDHGLSPHDVVLGFQVLGFSVSDYDWTLIRGMEVGEFSEGDGDDGYIVEDYDGEINGRLSYPKFTSDADTQISLRFGIWDRSTQTYDRERLKFINVPVLKSHHSTYGVTACIKHYMGVVTGSLSTNSHSAIAYGIMGKLLGEIQLADLNILDCIWINANPNSGPGTSYAGATRRDELVASLDPVAADIWAARHILIPAFIDNGFTPPWPYPSADPDDPNSAFRNYLDNSMNFILAAGHDVTNEEAQTDVVTWSGAGDLDGDGEPDGSDNCPYDANADQDDYDGDGIGDACECTGDADGSGDVTVVDFLQMLGAWGPCPGCPEDFDRSGDVGVTDFLDLLANWGPCY
jgi:hypothetical protein